MDILKFEGMGKTASIFALVILSRCGDFDPNYDRIDVRTSEIEPFTDQPRGDTTGPNSRPRSPKKPGEGPVPNPVDYTEGIKRILDEASHSSSRWSAYAVIRSQNGSLQNILDFNSSTCLRPASNMKLLTTWGLMSHQSSARNPTQSLFRRAVAMMKASDNDEAEQLFQFIGGAKVILGDIHHDIPGRYPCLAIMDGSGLSHSNALSSRMLVELLIHARKSPYHQHLESTFPISGTDGTLRDRLAAVRGKVHAKTGTLTRDPVTALSGYGRNKDGQDVIFSFLGDDVVSVSEGRKSIDNSVIMLLGLDPSSNAMLTLLSADPED